MTAAAIKLLPITSVRSVLHSIPRSIVRSGLAVGALSLLYTAPASAQQRVTLRQHELQPATSYTAPLDIQILDESPRVKDFRRRREVSPNYVLNIPALAPSKAPAGTIVLTPETNDLPRSGFESQIPAGGISAGHNLKPATMGGHAPQGAAASGARPLMSQSTHGNLTTRPGTQVAQADQGPAKYEAYPRGGDLTGGGDSSASSVRTSTTIRLRDKLINH